MIKLGYSGLELDSSVSIIQYIEKVRSRGQGFYEVIDDVNLLDRIDEFVVGVKATGFKKIVILGIGGSALGAICLKQVFGDLFISELKSSMEVEILDNIDPEMLMDCQKHLNLSETLFLVITKSGGTPETMAQFLYFRSLVSAQGLDFQKHFVFITDPHKGLLRELANQHSEIVTFAVPENVGGRFSVLTAVGLVPAALMGIDIRRLLEGARAMRERFFSADFSVNWPWQIALAQFTLYQNKINQTVMFPYAQKLWRFADWYRQLLGESIGKEQNRKGEKVNIGITPLVSLGATDQHSQNQLYNEGPNDKFYVFLEVLNSRVDLQIPFDETFAQDLGYLRGVSFNKLLLTEMEGTMAALLEKNRPMMKISLDKLGEFELGELFMLMEAATAFLGELFDIDTYNQPGVELSKVLTKKMLTQ